MERVDVAMKTSAVTQDGAGRNPNRLITASCSPKVYASGSNNFRSAADNNQNAKQQNELTELRHRCHKEPSVDEPRDRWVIVCFPKGWVKSMEHIDAFRIREDVELFREIRMRYEKLRPKWQRLLALRDLHRIRLVKVGVHIINDDAHF